MNWILVVLVMIGGGIVQSVIGSGGGVFMMLFFPYLFGMVTGSAIASPVAGAACIALAWKFRRDIDIKVCLLPAIVYIVVSVLFINFVREINTEILNPAFGVFLILLALYFFFFADRFEIKANWLTAVVCALISGACSGLFGIGGPTMALYFISATQDKKSYVANTQFMFSLTSISNLIARINNGIFTMDLVPITLVGLVAVNLGKNIGLKIFDRINREMMKKLVYGFVAISGVITVLESFL